ncbi:MAG: hydrogenase 4 subunit F [Candidatus Melainabacteria bacterium]|nr:hydrogenase 4 subunit F [Candidatus Melainabacteria bacterium]
MLLEYLFLIPIITGLICLIPKRPSCIGYTQVLGTLILFGIGLSTIQHTLNSGSIYFLNDLVYIDALSALMIFLITLVSLLASIYSIGYMKNQIEEKIHNIWKLKGYYLLINIFIFTMLMVVSTNNIGVMWIAIEATTLVSAFLVGYYNKERPVEAAWKYIILCTVGIAFAMIGIILAYYAATEVGGVRELSLNWDYLIHIAHKLDPTFIKIAFVFILIGFGTKAGLAPMHSWLPDAHSEAPTPVSALLSGVLIKCGIYCILRFTVLTNIAVGKDFTSGLLLVFGLLSLIIATFFILIQHNVKRLLAYHSLEHIGIITCGLAFGTPIAVFGALIHMINHAMVKTLMFFTSGNLALKYHTKDMTHIRGAINVMPFSGTALLVGGLALAGSPPFSIFLSEFYILRGGIQSHHYIASGLFLLMLVIVFGGLSQHLLEMAIGPVSNTSGEVVTIAKGEISKSSLLAIGIPLILVCLLGFYVPPPLFNLLNEATKIINLGHSL